MKRYFVTLVMKDGSATNYTKVCVIAMDGDSASRMMLTAASSDMRIPENQFIAEVE